MKANLTTVGIVAICIVILVIFLVWKNWKDKKELTKQLNEDFKHLNNRESDMDDAEE